MARSKSKVIPSSVNAAATPSASLVASPAALALCRDLHAWPRSWMGIDADLAPGEGLIICFVPFIEHLLTKGLTAKTLRLHVDNLWLLGGELIRAVHDDPPLRKLTPSQLLASAINEEGGPVIYRGSEETQRSLDSTCKKLHRFLTSP